MTKLEYIKLVFEILFYLVIGSVFGYMLSHHEFNCVMSGAWNSIVSYILGVGVITACGSMICILKVVIKGVFRRSLLEAQHEKVYIAVHGVFGAIGWFLIYSFLVFMSL